MRQPSTIDLSQLPAPRLIEALDADSYVRAALEDFQTRWPAYTALLQSDPVVKLIQVMAYRETLLRNRVNHAARATLLAFAGGSDLDHIGALFEVERMTMGTQGGNPVLEDDARFRRRIQLAPEAFSVAGPAGAYVYHALGCDPSIADAHAFSPRDGYVAVVVAGAAGEPVADAVLFKLLEKYAREDIVPLTDVVRVRRATRVDYAVEAILHLRRGPDPDAVKVEAERRLRTYAGERYVIGEDVFKVGITAALKAGGVENVSLIAPVTDISCAQDQIPHLSNVAIAVVAG